MADLEVQREKNKELLDKLKREGAESNKMREELKRIEELVRAHISFAHKSSSPKTCIHKYTYIYTYIHKRDRPHPTCKQSVLNQKR
jgi:hypothetical protein